MLDQAVADAAFSLKPGEVSDPIKGAVRRGAAPRRQDRAGDAKSLSPTSRRSSSSEIADGPREERDRQLTTRSRTSAPRGKRSPRPPRRSVSSRHRRRGRCAGPRQDGRRVADLPETPDAAARRLSPPISASTTTRSRCGTAAMSGTRSPASTPSHDRTLDEVKDKVAEQWHDDQVASDLQGKAGECSSSSKLGRRLAAARSEAGGSRSNMSTVQAPAADRTCFAGDVAASRVRHGQRTVRLRRKAPSRTTASSSR